MTLHSRALWRGMASSPTVSWTFCQQRCCYWLHLNPSNAVLSASCRSRLLPSWAVGSLQAWLYISTHLRIRSTFWMNFASFSGISLVMGGAWHLSVPAIAEQWSYVISSYKISWSRLGWAEALGFSLFFPSLLCGMKAWFLEQLCNHKGKAYGCWLGGVLAWLHRCSWFCESFQASCSMPDTHPAHIPSSRASDFKNLCCFFMRIRCLQWNRSPQLSFGGEIGIFCCRFLWQGAGREAGAVLVYLLLWFCSEVHTC